MSEKFTITPAAGVHVVRAGGAIIGETSRALILHENGYDPVVYFPREDAGMEFLDPSDTRTTCPHKGEATHYHIAAKSGPIKDAAWSYETPDMWPSTAKRRRSRRSDPPTPAQAPQ
jgi:uncharacterized protein (DUF427 family)